MSSRSFDRSSSGSCIVATRAEAGVLAYSDRVRVELLRSFGLAHGGRAVHVPMSVQRVVAFVALAGRPLQRLYVSGTLWLDSSEDHANACLRTALWRLGRTRLHVIESLGTQLRLHEDVEVDVREFAEQAELAIASASSPQGRLPRLCTSGDLLPDWYDDWVIVERERIRQLRLHGLEALCASLTAERRFAEAVAAGTAAVAAEPLRESAHRILIQAYLGEGNACEALRQYRLFRDLSRAQLGLEPSPALDQLIDHVRKS
jgi:DNA-binding SARP family transcriptional activator